MFVFFIFWKNRVMAFFKIMIGKFFTFMVYCKSWNLSQKSKPQVEQLDVILFLTVSTLIKEFSCMKEPIWFNLDIMQGVLMISKQQSRFGARHYLFRDTYLSFKGNSESPCTFKPNGLFSVIPVSLIYIYFFFFIQSLLTPSQWIAEVEARVLKK